MNCESRVTGLIRLPEYYDEMCLLISDAAAVYVAFALGAVAWYLTWGKAHFRGPPELAEY